MKRCVLLFIILAIPYIAYSQNASDSVEIAGTYECHQSTGWGNYTDPSSGNRMEVVPLPLWDATLIINKDSTFTRSIVMFSGNHETVVKGTWRIEQDSLVLHIKTSKPAFIAFEMDMPVNEEERLKIDSGSRLLIRRGEVYSKTD